MKKNQLFPKLVFKSNKMTIFQEASIYYQNQKILIEEEVNNISLQDLKSLFNTKRVIRIQKKLENLIVKQKKIIIQLQ